MIASHMVSRYPERLTANRADPAELIRDYSVNNSISAALVGPRKMPSN